MVDEALPYLQRFSSFSSLRVPRWCSWASIYFSPEGRGKTLGNNRENVGKGVEHVGKRYGKIVRKHGFPMEKTWGFQYGKNMNNIGKFTSSCPQLHLFHLHRLAPCRRGWLRTHDVPRVWSLSWHKAWSFQWQVTVPFRLQSFNMISCLIIYHIILAY